MLTPIDQPLDKLDDLTAEEMYVLELLRMRIYLLHVTIQREHEG